MANMFYAAWSLGSSNMQDARASVSCLHFLFLPVASQEIPRLFGYISEDGCMQDRAFCVELWKAAGALMFGRSSFSSDGHCQQCRPGPSGIRWPRLLTVHAGNGHVVRAVRAVACRRFPPRGPVLVF